MFDKHELEGVIRSLSSRDPDERARAASVFGNLVPDPSMPVEPLKEALNADDGSVVFWCLIALRRLEVDAPREVVERLVLEHSQGAVRDAALAYLVQSSEADRRLRSVLTAALHDPCDFVRRTAMREILNVSGWTKDEMARVLDSGAGDQSWMWRGITDRFQKE